MKYSRITAPDNKGRQAQYDHAPGTAQHHPQRLAAVGIQDSDQVAHHQSPIGQDSLLEFTPENELKTD
jgi:hypothetical protein